MNVAPLCILQMRYHSTRLPAKMLQTLGNETLAARGYRIACEAFGKINTIFAVPQSDQDGPLGAELERIGARGLWYTGEENDVLGRFHIAAHTYRWHPDAVIVRYTPDDPWKDVLALRHVASGARWPVEFGGEAFTLAQLDAAHASITDPEKREHITRALFDQPGPDIATSWFYEFGCTVATIDTEADLLAARAKLAEMEG